jgi:hypothetical protein
MSAHHQLCNEVQHTEHKHHEVTRSSHSKRKLHEVGNQKQDPD